jgi:hypothetical protein
VSLAQQFVDVVGYGLPVCTNLEISYAGITDPEFLVFAVIGTSTR